VTLRPIVPSTVVAVAAGGAAGAVLRHLLTEAFPLAGFPWATFAINVSGSFLLALLPALAVVRSRPALVAALGPGLLGGYTTLSAYSEESRALLADGRLTVAAAYVAGTLVACLLAVALADRFSAPEERAEFESEEGDL
jgi:fluoride exporter